MELKCSILLERMLPRKGISLKEDLAKPMEPIVNKKSLIQATIKGHAFFCILQSM